MTWRVISTAPKRESVLVATRGYATGQWIVGEAYHRFEGDGDDGWWWANQDPGDYHAQSLESAGIPPLWWMPLPKPPQG